MSTIKIIICINTLLAVLLLNCSSGNVDVASGQGGEAVVIGIIRYADGVAAVGENVSLAPYDYSPLGDSKELMEATSDSSGTFEFSVSENGKYTLSARNDTSVFYKSNVHISDGSKEVDLGELSFYSGAKVTIVPWWDSDGETSLLGIKGTPWITNMKTNGLTPLLLPEEEIMFIHSDGESVDTLTKIISDSIIGAEQILDDIKYLIDDSLYYNIFYIRIDNYSASNNYFVDWGDGTPIVTFESNRVDHTYEDGVFTVRFYAKSKNNSNAISPIYTHKITTII